MNTGHKTEDNDDDDADTDSDQLYLSSMLGQNETKWYMIEHFIGLG